MVILMITKNNAEDDEDDDDDDDDDIGNASIFTDQSQIILIAKHNGAIG